MLIFQTRRTAVVFQSSIFMLIPQIKIRHAILNDWTPYCKTVGCSCFECLVYSLYYPS